MKLKKLKYDNIQAVIEWYIIFLSQNRISVKITGGGEYLLDGYSLKNNYKKLTKILKQN